MRFANSVWAGIFCATAFVLPTQAREPQRWVPPPAPRVENGAAIVPVAEVFGDSRYILHLPKPEQTDWRQKRYEVRMSRSDEQPLAVTLTTVPFDKEDEVVFFTIPKGAAEKYALEVIDKASYPYKRVWSGSVGEIAQMK